jgi:two-component system, chemotaxis family, CheB/CheR fusion protein
MDESATPVRQEEDGGNGRRKLRILVADDDPDTASSSALLFQAFGHEVAVAPDGPAVLAAAQAQEPDVVLLDIGLPKMNGYEVARRLRALGNGKKPFLLAVSGFGGEEHQRRCAEAGIDMVLLKPADPELLRQLLESLHGVDHG